ncbi:hypothetical protein RGQ13_06510 [Thalassotalea psychrophila]|uniref:Sortilin N-terminal domain-containing protein n=1 Tax=Thalassotalea psychrophila TaxID=3065647 RepID=A0ABY9TXY1_9GAMM|nr:hypothetical protein RGQ13_06510 [Colwelliaceae bacterium SQ149]
MKKLIALLSASAVFMIGVTACSNITGGDGATASNESSSQIPRVAKPEKLAANTDALQWRFIGPMTGNRGSAVVGHPVDKNVFFHAASNGLWKTIDAGQYWIPVGDDQFNEGSIGAVEISESHPDVMWVGTGEPQMRNNVTWGDGVYKSVDGGDTWTHMGLKDTKHISQVRIHPTNPDIVYVGAYGHAYGPNKERGVYKTVDGGNTWKQVLFKSEKAGVIDLIVSHANPDHIFAAMWEFERKAWGPKTAGPDTGLWKSTDGGETWNDISRNPGLPQDGGYGRIGVTMSAADGNRVYALIDSETKAGVYRSYDLGETWELASDYFQITGRPFYYSHIYANPSNADEIWSPNNRTFSSTDAGTTWIVEPGTKDDQHDVWIDKNDANRMIITHDGGVQVSLNGGMTWSQQFTQKLGQFYRVDTDNDFPYNVYGSMQDTNAWKVASASKWGPISITYNTILGDGETGSVFPDPNDLDIVYAIGQASTIGGTGSFSVNNLKTGENEHRGLYPEPIFGLNAHELDYRFNWNSPLFISKHDNKTLYIAGNVVFKSMDQGMSWDVISDDLTNDYKDKQLITGSGWLPEYFGQEIYSTINRMVESPLKQGLIWTGSDDGKVFITQDGGKKWADVTIPGLPKYSKIYEVEASPHAAGTAYVGISNYKTNDDYKPYLYKTTDYGKTWTNLSANLPQDNIVRTVREDITKQGLLYVGTGNGILASMDDGKSWVDISENMPAVMVTDIKVRADDLVVSTMGRGFWVLDNISPLREHNADLGNHLYDIYDYTRFAHKWWMDYAPGGDPGGMKKYFIQNLHPGQTFFELGVINGEKKRIYVDAGDAEHWGALVYFKLSAAAKDKDISISILDSHDNVIVTHPKESLVLTYTDSASESLNSGLNRFVWNMRYPMVSSIPMRPPTSIRPIATPGKYKVKLTVGSDSMVEEFSLNAHPDSPTTKDDQQEKAKFWMGLYAKAESSTQRILAALKVKADTLAKVEEMQSAGAANAVDAEKLAAEITRIVDEYEATYVPTGRTMAEVINLPAKIFTKLIQLSASMEVTENRPTQAMKNVYGKLEKLMAEADAAYDAEIKVAQANFDNAVN